MNNSILQLLLLKNCLNRAWCNILIRLHCLTFFYLHNGRRQLSWKSMCSISRTRRASVHYLHVWHNLHRQLHPREKPLLCGVQHLRQVVQWWHQLMPVQNFLNTGRDSKGKILRRQTYQWCNAHVHSPIQARIKLRRSKPSRGDPDGP